MNNYFSSMTKEQREEALAKAREARTLRAQEREANKHKFKLHYLDSGYWADLASKYKIRMPNSEEGVTASVIRKYLKLVNVSVEKWNEHYTSMSYFVKHNPTYTKYAAAGLVLELKEDMSNAI